MGQPTYRLPFFVTRLSVSAACLADVPQASSSGNVILVPKEHAVKKIRYTEEQTACALKQAETGTSVVEVIRGMIGTAPHMGIAW